MGCANGICLGVHPLKKVAHRDRKPEADLLREAAAKVARSLLRDHVTMPADPNNPTESVTDASTGGALPLVNCACVGCTWSLHMLASEKNIGSANRRKLAK